VDGAEYPPGGAKIRIEGGRFTTLNMGGDYAGDLLINEASEPKTIDMRFDQGPHRGETSFGIYELSVDQWKLCLGITGKPRPVQFVSAPGTGHALEILRRDIGN
jgi:uncharacterized protein (TIGR03067 family)